MKFIYLFYKYIYYYIYLLLYIQGFTLKIKTAQAENWTLKFPMFQNTLLRNSTFIQDTLDGAITADSFLAKAHATQ